MGIEIIKNRAKGIIFLLQCSYINASLQKFGFENIKPLSILKNLSTWLISDQLFKSTTEIAYMAKILYQKVIGKLICVAIGTQPDIIYTVQVLLHFMKTSSETY